MHHPGYLHERDPTGETGVSDLERERSLIMASVQAHCGPRAECLKRRRLLGRAALLWGSISRVAVPRDVSWFDQADVLPRFTTSGERLGPNCNAASSGSDGAAWFIVPDDKTTTTGEEEEAGAGEREEEGREEDKTGRETGRGKGGEREGETGKEEEGGGKGGGGRGGGGSGGGKGGGGRGGKGKEAGGEERGGEEETGKARRKEEQREKGRREEERRRTKRKAKREGNEENQLERMNSSDLRRQKPDSCEHSIRVNVWQ